jgi:murein L,D-transpeptidase YcbB/YkuD
VPPTIYRQDKLPEIRRNIAYLANNRLKVLDRDGRELNPATIDWQNPGPIKLRQDPGPDNALGLIVFRFPNPFSVYLHDTPSQSLFASHRRNYSSGCVRVEGAKQLADELFAGASQETHNSITDSIKRRLTRNIPLPVKVPILMDYWTAAAYEDGRVEFRPDVYGRDEELMAALKAQERRINAFFTDVSP